MFTKRQTRLKSSHDLRTVKSLLKGKERKRATEKWTKLKALMFFIVGLNEALGAEMGERNCNTKFSSYEMINQIRSSYKRRWGNETERRLYGRDVSLPNGREYVRIIRPFVEYRIWCWGNLSPKSFTHPMQAQRPTLLSTAVLVHLGIADVSLWAYDLHTGRPLPHAILILVLYSTWFVVFHTPAQ